MISRIKGELCQFDDQWALVENAGVYYKILLPSALADRLRREQPLGSKISFETIYYIEAGDKKSNHYPRLIGFLSPVDREFFSIYTQVPGMGMKKGLRSLVLPVSEIAAAIETKDTTTLGRLPGVGGRMADKIIAELNGKMARFALAKDSEPLAALTRTAPAFVDEAKEILTQLQYSEAEAREMIESTLKQNGKVKSAEELISLVFKSSRMAEV